MKNVVAVGLSVLLTLSLAPLLASAQPSISEMEECYNKMMAFRKDLIDLGDYSQGVDKTAARGLINIATEYTTKIGHLRDLLVILTLIRNDDNRNRVKPVVGVRMKHIAEGIDISLKEVNLEISQARSSAIISTSNQMKTELRRLQELLSPVSGK